jgi:ADP-ribose pyrophosphatase YjhB (NUDIX family)
MSPIGPAGDPRAPYARVAVVGLICRHDEESDGERWLLIHREQPTEAWDPPGGRMELGEDLAAAVIREVREETGLEIEVGGPCYALLTVYKAERLLAVSMACRPASDPDHLRLEPGAASEWRWVAAEEWEGSARLGRSSWDARDVRRATRMARVLWQTEEQ